jgi:molecular chaperone GrpE
MAKLLAENEQHLLPAADLAEEIERLHENLRDERDLRLRTLADFKNYRRRIERDGNRLAEDGKREILLSLLDIIDDMDKTLQWADDGQQNLLKGVQNIQQKLLALLDTFGVIPINSVGTPFNHDLHEAVAMAEHEDIEQGTVVAESRRGYLWKNELLRPAQVRVAG